MKGNEVLLTLKKHGFEQGTQKVLLRLAEENEDLQRGIIETVKNFEQLVRVQSMLNGAMDGMKAVIDKYNMKDGDARSTQEIARGE